ncbi:MAG: DNA primase [Candidatus Gottesmanbacteria bacterium]
MGNADEVKSRLNIIDVISEKVQLKKSGRNFKGLCPFHNEKTPSFMVSPDRQVFHCFGCGKGGSVIDFVMEYNHVDFPEALEELASRAGVTLSLVKSESPERKLKNAIYEINALASEFYQYLLIKHPLGEKALLYLKNRGITDKSIKTFSLGYSPNSWEALYQFLKKKKYSEELIEKAGLALRGNRGLYDRFRGRLIFTLRDHRGKVVGFSGRVLNPSIKEAKYINTSETPVYSKSNVLYAFDVTHEAIARANEAILMEGELDVISSFQAGVSNVVAIKGSALTEGHVHLLKRYTERIIFSLDSDIAGDMAARRGIDIAERAGLDMKVAVLPVGKDPDEAVREDPIGFKKAMKNAIPIYDYFIASAIKRFDITSAFGKKKASEELFPVMSKIENSIVQGHYIKKVAQALDVSEDVIIDGVKKVKLPIGLSRNQLPASKPQESFAISGPERLELYCLGLVLQGDTKKLYEEFSAVITSGDIKHMGVRRIVEAISLYIHGETPFVVADFAKILSKELLPVLDEAYLWDISVSTENSDLFAKEWLRTLKEVQKSILKRKMREVSDKIRSTDEKEEGQTQEKLAKLASEYALLEKTS